MKAFLIPYGLIAILAVMLDQAIKLAVEAYLPMHEGLPVLPFLALYRTHNTGIAFSMMADFGSMGLVALTLVVTAFIVWIAARTDPRQVLARYGFALIIGGAIGNLIDRAFLGYVVDYILFHLPNWSFAVFNLADAFISVGAAMVVLDEFLVWRRARSAERNG